jgi:hypothetical protein
LPCFAMHLLLTKDVQVCCAVSSVRNASAPLSPRDMNANQACAALSPKPLPQQHRPAVDAFRLGNGDALPPQPAPGPGSPSGSFGSENMESCPQASAPGQPACDAISPLDAGPAMRALAMSFDNARLEDHGTAAATASSQPPHAADPCSPHRSSRSGRVAAVTRAPAPFHMRQGLDADADCLQSAVRPLQQSDSADLLSPSLAALLRSLDGQEALAASAACVAVGRCGPPASDASSSSAHQRHREPDRTTSAACERVADAPVNAHQELAQVTAKEQRVASAHAPKPDQSRSWCASTLELLLVSMTARARAVLPTPKQYTLFQTV